MKAVCGNTPLAVRDVTPLVRLEVLGLFEQNVPFHKTLRLSCLNVEIAVFQTCFACSSQTHPKKEMLSKRRTGQLETLLLHWQYLLQCDFVQTSRSSSYHSTRYIFTSNEYLYFDRLGSVRKNDLTPCITASYIPAVHSSLDLGTR